MKYKVGDKVRFLSESGFSFVSPITGTTGVIKKVIDDNLYTIDTPEYEDLTFWGHEIEPINAIQVGETYPTQSQGSYKCIAIEGNTAWMIWSEISAAYRWNASTGKSLCLNASYDIDLTPKPVRETVEYVGHWDDGSYNFYNEHLAMGGCHPIRITFEKVDGIPDWSTLKAENVE